MKKTFLLYLYVLFFIVGGITGLQEAKSQTALFDTAFKYFEGASQPDINWKTTGYDDSSWKQGYFSIGWGDGDDSTIINKVPTVYIRYDVEITDKSLLHDLIFWADFDDAFVAYVNGVEFARANLGKMYSKTSYNQLADRSHEAESYRSLQSTVSGYYIDDSIISKYMVNGKNIFAVEVHNDSTNGSDLSMDANLYNLNGYYNMYNPHSRYKRSMELDSTLLPIVVIESDEFGIPVSHIHVIATMGIINNGSGKYNHPSDTYNEYNGRIRIEVRGQSSKDFPKRPYNIELQDKNGNDTSFSLMGMPKESDWVLQGPFADKSQIRNAMIYELGRKTGHWSPRTAFCEVILNGEFVGLYNLIEKIKRDSNRINIAKLKPDEISGNDLTGGYIFKYDKGSTGIQIVYPKDKGNGIPDEQRDYITNLVHEYESVLRTNSAFDPNLGYKKYIDCNSLVDNMVIAELGKNCDSYLYSSYMYKDRDDRNSKIMYGPLWDFDLCFGNATWQDGNKLNEWQFDFPANNRFSITRLLQDTSFVHLFQNRWKELRKSFLSDDSLMAMIDTLTTTLAGPIKRNYEVWPVIGKKLFWPAYDIFSYDEEIAYIKNWISERTAWVDDNIDNIYYDITNYSDVQEPLAENYSIGNIYPNPFTDELNISINVDHPSDISVNLISVNGSIDNIISPASVPQGDYIIHWKARRDYPVGLYILEVRIDGKVAGMYKVLKKGSRQ